MSGFLVASQREEDLEVFHLEGGAARSLGVLPVVGALFLIAHAERPLIHVAGDTDGGTITTLNVATGERTSITGVGERPCYLHLVDDDHLVCANYRSGTLAAIALDQGAVKGVASTLDLPGTPRLGAKKDRQEHSHPHAILPWSGKLLVTDLGTDAVHEVELVGSELRLCGQFAELPAGAGPRHVEPGHPGELWVTRELDNGVSLITPDGISTISATMNGFNNQVGDIVAHEPSGTVAVANRDVGTFAVFRHARLGIERVAEVSCGGTWPAQFATDGEALAVANRDSNSVAVFTGREYWKSAPEILTVPRPVSVHRAPGWVQTVGA